MSGPATRGEPMVHTEWCMKWHDASLPCVDVAPVDYDNRMDVTELIGHLVDTAFLNDDAQLMRAARLISELKVDLDYAEREIARLQRAL